MRILHLTYRVPFPANDGGSIAISNMILGLSQNGCILDVVAINTPKHKQAEATENRTYDQYNVFVDTNISALKLMKNVAFGSIPYNVERFYSKAVADQLKTLLNEHHYDFIQLESAFTALYMDDIRKHTDVPVIIRTHNIEYLIWERLSVHEKNPLKKMFFKHLSKRLKKFETVYYSKADGIASITTDDRLRMLEMGVTSPISVVPAGIVLDKYVKYKGDSGKPTTIFSISSLDWMPNIEGLKWFLKQVWPQVTAAKPELELHIAGKATPQWLKELNQKNVVVHGFVDDSIAFMNAYQLMIVPLLSGSGMRVKIIEGFASGKCVISTSVGAEGIPYTHDENIVIADTVDEWVNAITSLLEKDEKRIAIEQKAQELVCREFENKSVTGKVLGLYYQIKEDRSK
ncbi:MAG: glycosyltransferase family 4 protein [Ignavibacteriaceae bacterium]|nr:glycosyltransferase family 4 protein [Ignavibacteriaceae bacterium]